MKCFLKLLLLIISFLFYIYYAPPVYATNYVQGPVLVGVSATSYSICSNTSFCTTAGIECWNSESPGVTNCGQACSINGRTFGSAWTKYRYGGCVETDYNEFTDTETCNPVYNEISAVYSTADKCSDGSSNPPPEPYLRGGLCSGRIGGIYKTCCTDTTPSVVSNSSCRPIQPLSGAPYPPYDGICPAGSHWERCGGPGYPACGQEACGALPSPSPTIACPSLNCSYSQVVDGVTRCYSGHTDNTSCSSSNLYQCFNNTTCNFVSADSCTGTASREIDCPSYSCSLTAQATSQNSASAQITEQNNPSNLYNRTNWQIKRTSDNTVIGNFNDTTSLTQAFTGLTGGTQYTVTATRYASTSPSTNRSDCGTATLTAPLGQCTLTPNPQTTTAGQQVTWGLVGPSSGTSATWTNLDNNLVTTTISGPSPGSNNTNQWTDTKTYSTQGTYQRQASIRNSSGSEICAPQASVTINPIRETPGQCGVTLSASSSSITAGQPVTLSWSSTDGAGGTVRTASLVASGSWSGSRTPLQNGSTTYQQLAGPTIYTFDLTCYDGAGRAGNTATATVSVTESQVTTCNDRAHSCGTNNYGLLPDPGVYCGTTAGTDVRWAYANDSRLDTACQAPNNGGKDYCYVCYHTPQGATTTPSSEPAPLKPPAPLLTFGSTFWNAPLLARIFEDRDDTQRYQTLVTDPDYLTGFFGGIRWGSGCRYDFSRPCPGRICSNGFISDFELNCSPGNVATPINLTTGPLNILKGSPVYNIAKSDPVFGLYTWEANQDTYSEKRSISYSGSNNSAGIASNFIKLNTGTTISGDQVNNKTTTSISPFNLYGLFSRTVTYEQPRWCGGYETNYRYYRCGWRTLGISKDIIATNTTDDSCQNGCTVQSKIEYPGTNVASYTTGGDWESTSYPDASCQALSDSCSPDANPQTCNLVTSSWNDPHYSSCSLTRYQKTTNRITPWSLTITTPRINNVEETVTNLSAQNKGWTDLFEVPANYNRCMVQTQCTGQIYSCLWNEVTPKYVPSPDCPAGAGPNPAWTNYDARCSYEYRNTNCSCSFDLYCFEDGCFRATESYNCSLPLKTAYQNFNLTPPGKYLFEMKIKPRSVKEINVSSGNVRQVSNDFNVIVNVSNANLLVNNSFTPDVNGPRILSSLSTMVSYSEAGGGLIKAYLSVPTPAAGSTGAPVTITVTQAGRGSEIIEEVAFDPPTLTALGWTEGSLPFGRTGNSYIENLTVSVPTSNQLNTVVGIKNQSLNPALTCPPAGSDNFCSKDNTAYTVVAPERVNMLDVLLGKPPPPLPAWLQVVGGDVHSNVKIESPGGPRP